MVTCTAGQPQCTTGQMAVTVLSAADAKCVGTIAWLPRHLQWQLSGTMRKTLVLLIVWWHKAISPLLGTVTPVAISGVRHPTPGSAQQELAALSALKLQGLQARSSTQALQRTLSYWLSGITVAMQSWGTSLTKSVLELCGCTPLAPSVEPGEALFIGTPDEYLCIRREHEGVLHKSDCSSLGCYR